MVCRCGEDSRAGEIEMEYCDAIRVPRFELLRFGHCSKDDPRKGEKALIHEMFLCYLERAQL